LETKLGLQNPVQQLAVLAAVAVVGPLIRAHDASRASFETVHKREDIELVNGAVIDVRAHRFTFKARVAAVFLDSQVSKTSRTLV
jgi:hypothetical protein